MTERISYQELKHRLRDIDIPDSELAPFFTGDPDLSSAMNPVLRVNPATVDLGAPERVEAEAAAAMSVFNGIARWRRKQRFDRDVSRFPNRPVLLAEGDSWFQFPILIDETIDSLLDDHDYLVDCVSAAGDTLQNMVINGDVEYESLIREYPGTIAAFIFSGAGNDIIGTDVLTGRSVIENIVLPFAPGRGPAQYINNPAFKSTMAFIESAYMRVIGTVRALRPNLRIVIHGYDYAIPGGFPGDPRRPVYASQDQWLGRPFAKLGITDQALRQAIVKAMVDKLYTVLRRVAATDTNTVCVDIRGTNKTVDLWNDEIHPTNAGFKRVAARLHTALTS
ncbi:hypothetical protein HFO33_29145 [Rhizobium leguminosarum]|uniref:hypothetical protein n=1 Tax=Rhizobium leguminosarum TaxID=384 RepID=UPI001C955A2A|nr:hypothetical protein [Rhizobium leguminosarum]MBY5720610.1 hypothetical protein [Rhizobium leguminosarum]